MCVCVCVRVCVNLCTLSAYKAVIFREDIFMFLRNGLVHGKLDIGPRKVLGYLDEKEGRSKGDYTIPFLF